MFFSSSKTTLITRGTTINGDILINDHLEVEGTVNGRIIAETGSAASLRLMEHGVVEGNIQVPSVIINGRIVGDVIAAEHVELAAKAHVVGDVYYSSIEIVKGAEINGNLVHGVPEPVAKTPASEPRVNEGDTSTGDYVESLLS